MTLRRYGNGEGRCLYLSADVRQCPFLSDNVCVLRKKDTYGVVVIDFLFDNCEDF